jgi:tRNA-binding protein
MDPVTAFQTLDLRVGRVLEATLNARARKPSYVVRVDFGEELGVRTSSAQLTVHYRPEELVGRLVVAAVNLGSRNIAGVLSEVLVLGLPDPEGAVVLLQPERDVPLGGRVY